ncbi:MAG: ParA family partition ATPase [Candidatus Margulisiibacteriota bacterium]
MKTIAVLSQKGGAGKTTISINLADALFRRGLKVLLVDSDPQGSSRDWRETNLDGKIPVLGLDRESLASDIKAVDSNYDIVIIDGAPRVAKLSSAAIRVANLVLIPVQPSPMDIWACAELVDTVIARREVADGLPAAYFVVSRAIKNTKLSKQVTTAVKEYGLDVLKSRTTNRISYPSTASEGKTVFDSDDEVAKAEIDALADEVLEIIHA